MTQTQTFPNTQPILTALAAALDPDTFHVAYVALAEANLLSAADIRHARMLDPQYNTLVAS